MEGVESKKGRKKASLCQLPESLLENKSPEEAEGLVQGYRILQKLLNSKLVGPFLEVPDEKEDEIMATYYEVIDDPLWFNKVKEKYLKGSYSTLPEFVLDVRKIFANCFRFHGPKGHLTKSALKLEAILEQELKLLPEETQAVCSITSTHNFKETDLVYKKEGVTSLLLQWVINEQSEEEMAKNEDVPLIERKEKLDNLEKEIVSWENGILYYEENVQDCINSMFELPQIGLFISVTSFYFSLERLSQYEVERMLLVPQYSKSLAILMTALLTSRRDKSKMLFGPPMPYEIWSSRLSNKVSTWYKTYYSKKRNFVEVLNAIGVEHMFWLVMGEPNPLEKFQFHDLILQKRVWILKTLCDTIMHNQKTMYDLFSNKSDYCPQFLGEDRKGHTYIYFPSFSDLRVYRQAKSTFSKFNITRWERLVRVPVAAGDSDSVPNKCVLPSRNEFELIATSISELKTVYTNLIETEFPSKGVCDKNSSLLQNIDKLLTELSPNDLKYQTEFHLVRRKMYHEWKAMYERSPESVSFAITYWEKSSSQDGDESEEKKSLEKESEPIKDNEGKEMHADELKETVTLRERKSKTDSHLSMKLLALNEARGESDTSDESDDLCSDSEEEWVASQSRRKLKQGTVKKRRRPSTKINGDEAQEMVEKNIRKNRELEQQKKDEKAQRLNQPVISRDDSIVSEEPKKIIQIKCKEAYKLLKNVNGPSVKTESFSVIKNLVATANVKAEGTKIASPETIDIDDDDEKKEKDENVKTINLSLRVELPQAGSADPSSPVDDDIEVLEEAIKPPVIISSFQSTNPPTFAPNQVSASPAAPSIRQPQFVPRPQVPHSQIRPQRPIYANVPRGQTPLDPKIHPNAQFSKGAPVMRAPSYINNNLTPIKQTFPVVRGPRMMQQTFRGMVSPRGMPARGLSPRIPGQVRAPRQRARFSAPSPIMNSPRAYRMTRTSPQQRFNLAQSTLTNNNISRRLAPTTPSTTVLPNSRTTNFASGTPSKAVSNILNSVAIANTLSASGKRKSSLLNSITITPINNSAVTITPVASSPNQGKKVSRSLNFSSPNKSNRLVYIKGTIVLDANDFCYSVQIADGRKFKLSPEQLEECRVNNNGVMPTSISIPVPEDVANLLKPEIIEID